MIDLVDECGDDLSANGYKCEKLERYNMTSCELFVKNKKESNKLGFEIGAYYILNAPYFSLLMPEHRQLLKNWLLGKVKHLFEQLKIKKSSKILVVGIGNPAIVADSFGVKVAQKIKIEPYKKKNRLFKLIPNTFLNTGINAFDVIRLIVEFFDISAVILFDSLATQNLSRLGCSLQINDAGLTPGSATSNFGKSICKNTLGVPCIAVGVPMMISARALGHKSDVVFTEKDVEERVVFLSNIVAEVISELL